MVEPTNLQLDGEASKEPVKKDPFKARVSSAVLRHASPVLYKEFDPDGPWAQPPVQSDGLIHKRYQDFDPDAFRHVLNIVHFRGSLLPKTLPQEDLAKVAVIVDYLQCHEATTFVTQSWVQDYKQGGDVFDRSATLWLFIFCIFNREEMFQFNANKAVRHNSTPLDTLGLAFPSRIVRK